MVVILSMCIAVAAGVAETNCIYHPRCSIRVPLPHTLTMFPLTSLSDNCHAATMTYLYGAGTSKRQVALHMGRSAGNLLNAIQRSGSRLKDENRQLKRGQRMESGRTFTNAEMESDV